jgi:uncharacterized lipoprotein YajG
MRLKLLSAAAAILTLTSCAATCKTTALSVPVEPTLMRVSDAELMCLSDNVYSKLARRDVQRRQYGEELKAIIESTH